MLLLKLECGQDTRINVSTKCHLIASVRITLDESLIWKEALLTEKGSLLLAGTLVQGWLREFLPFASAVFEWDSSWTVTDLPFTACSTVDNFPERIPCHRLMSLLRDVSWYITQTLQIGAWSDACWGKVLKIRRQENSSLSRRHWAKLSFCSHISVE